METFWDSRCPREKIFERKSVEFLFFSTAGRTNLGFWWSTTVFDKQTNNFVHIESENKGCFCFGGLTWFETHKHTVFFSVSRRSSQRKVEEQTPYEPKESATRVDSRNPSGPLFWSSWMYITSRLDVDSVLYLYKNRRTNEIQNQIQSIFEKF